MLKKLFICALSFFIMPYIIYAQYISPQAISSGGTYSAKKNTSLSYTGGLTFSGSLSSGNTLLTQGFQQSYTQLPVIGHCISPSRKNIPYVSFKVYGTTKSTGLTNQAGQFNLVLPTLFNNAIKPSKNNETNKANGVTALDIALVQSHVLGKSILSSPFKIIAADVNGDNKVTALDIVYIKRLILGIDTTFTNTSTSEKRLWAFVDSSYKFVDSTNPFPIKDSISYAGLSIGKINQTFVGCKLGDVNWDWNPTLSKPYNNPVNAVEFSYEPVQYTSDGSTVSNEIRIPIKVKNFKDLLGMQFTISFDASVLNWQGLGNNPLGLETGTTHANEGSVSFIWVDAKNEIKTLEDGSVLFELVFKRTGKEAIGNTLTLDGSIAAIAAYDKDYNLYGIVMKPSLINITDIAKETWVAAPNPVTDGMIRVQMNLKDKKTIVFRLSDNAGRVLLVKQVEGVKGSNNINLNKGNIPSGTYFLQAAGIEGIKQLIIEN